MSNTEINIYMKCMKIIALVCACMMLTGCKNVEYVPVETVRVDSTVVRDTLMRMELVPYRDSVAVRDTVSFLCNPYAYSWAKWSGGVLSHSLGIWPTAQATVKVPYFIDRYVRVKVPEVVEVEKKLSRWDNIRINVGGYAIVTVGLIIITGLGLLIYKLRR